MWLCAATAPTRADLRSASGLRAGTRREQLSDDSQLVERGHRGQRGPRRTYSREYTITKSINFALFWVYL